MPRVLSMRKLMLQPADRESFRAMARSHREKFVGAGCRYWAFEDDRGDGQYLEFIEAADRAALEQAGAVATSDGPAHPVFVELDLS